MVAAPVTEVRGRARVVAEPVSVPEYRDSAAVVSRAPGGDDGRGRSLTRSRGPVVVHHGEESTGERPSAIGEPRTLRHAGTRLAARERVR